MTKKEQVLISFLIGLTTFTVSLSIDLASNLHKQNHRIEALELRPTPTPIIYNSQPIYDYINQKTEQLEVAVTENIYNNISDLRTEMTEEIISNHPDIANRWNIKLTEDEIDLLAQIVILEAGDQPDVGQQAVVEVIFNRMVSEEYPDTLYDVVSQKGQFAVWSFHDKAEPTARVYKNILAVLDGKTSILSDRHLFFATYKANGKNFFKIGDHWFSEY